MKHLYLALVVGLLLLAACTPSTEPSAAGPIASDNEVQIEPTPLDMDDPLVRDAAAFAQSEDIPLEEAVRRLEFQQTIGDIQPALQADFPDAYGGLWVQHQPEYRIVIALTEGDASTVQPYVEGKPWAEFVEVRRVEYTLADLLSAQAAATQAASQLNAAVTASVDVRQNRVELIVGNPDLLQADLEAAGILLPDSVQILPITLDQPLPDTNQGVLLEATTAGGRTIYLPKQPPTAESMAALMDGTLIEVDGCLRLTGEGYEEGFLVLWPYDSDIRIAGETIEVLNGRMEVIARAGSPARMGGGAMESARSIAGLDESTPGLPIDGCPGPYWVAGEIETLEAQAVPDIIVTPFTSGDRLLAIFMTQSRPNPEEEVLSGELVVDEQSCMRIEGYAILWPPGIFLREEPLRLTAQGEVTIAQVGDTIRVSGGEKTAGDYRYFENKVRCPGPYWGANEVSPAAN